MAWDQLNINSYAHHSIYALNPKQIVEIYMCVCVSSYFIEWRRTIFASLRSQVSCDLSHLLCFPCWDIIIIGASYLFAISYNLCDTRQPKKKERKRQKSSILSNNRNICCSSHHIFLGLTLCVEFWDILGFITDENSTET